MKINKLHTTIVLVSMAAVCPMTAGFSATSEIQCGTITPKVICAANPDHSYAVFLPKDYTPIAPGPLSTDFRPTGPVWRR